MSRPAFDRSLPLLVRGYDYLWQHRRDHPDRSLWLRILGRRTAVLGGPDGARAFYGPDLRRRGAIPPPLADVLFGRDAVHKLDDAEHHHRKAMFVGLLPPRAAREVGALAEKQWRAAAATWAARGTPVTVFDEAVGVHCRAICDWAGVPDDCVPATLGHDLITVVDGFGSVGPRYARAVLARRRVDAWAAGLVRSVRDGQVEVADGSAVATVAAHRDGDGRLLPAHTAGVELLNILRPTVAVAYFAAFTALAMHDHPEVRQRLRTGDDPYLEAFAHETRRFYPFVPMLAARTRHRTTIGGTAVPRGRRVLLDVYGTLHDPALWPDPDRFDPRRFLGVEPDAFTLIPQGGGDAATGHRCPGERTTIELIKAAATFLADLDHELPQQDLRVRLNRIPARPASKVVLALPAGAPAAAHRS